MKNKITDKIRENKKPIIIVILSIVALFSFIKLRKFLKLRKFKYSVSEFKLLNELTATALQKGVDTLIKLNLQNYSNSSFDLNQISVDLYTPSGELIAEQQNPLSKTIELEKNNTSPLGLVHHIEPKGLMTLLKESNIIDPDDSIFNTAMKIFTLDLSGVELLAKGFVVIDGISKEFNQKITL